MAGLSGIFLLELFYSHVPVGVGRGTDIVGKMLILAPLGKLIVLLTT